MPGTDLETSLSHIADSPALPPSALWIKPITNTVGVCQGNWGGSHLTKMMCFSAKVTRFIKLLSTDKGGGGKH